MYLGGDWVDTKKQRWKAGGWAQEEEGGTVRSLSTMALLSIMKTDHACKQDRESEQDAHRLHF